VADTAGPADQDKPADPADPASAARRRLVPPLREVVFRRYWTASTISMVGDQVTTIAVPLTAVLALHAGAAMMGYLTA